MILAAGIGTRLRPLTDNKPKALIEVQKVPLLNIQSGPEVLRVDEIIINVHHFAGQIVEFSKKTNSRTAHCHIR